MKTGARLGLVGVLGLMAACAGSQKPVVTMPSEGFLADAALA